MKLRELKKVLECAGVNIFTKLKPDKENISYLADLLSVDYRTISGLLTSNEKDDKDIPAPWSCVIRHVFEYNLLQKRIQRILQRLFDEVVEAEYYCLLLRRSGELVNLANTSRNHFNEFNTDDEKLTDPNQKYFRNEEIRRVISGDMPYSLSMKTFINGGSIILSGKEDIVTHKSMHDSRKHNNSTHLTGGVCHSLVKICIDLKPPDKALAEHFCLLNVENKLDSNGKVQIPGNELEKIFTYEEKEELERKVKHLICDKKEGISELMFALDYHLEYPKRR